MSYENPHSAIISVVKGTFNDLIGKEHTSASVGAKLLPGTLGEIGAKWGTYSDSTDQTVSRASTDAPPQKVCALKTLVFFLYFSSCFYV